MLGFNAVYGLNLFYPTKLISLYEDRWRVFVDLILARAKIGTYRQQALLASHRNDRVVTLGPATSRVNEQEHRLVEEGYRGFLGKHDIEEFAFENLLT